MLEAEVAFFGAALSMRGALGGEVGGAEVVRFEVEDRGLLAAPPGGFTWNTPALCGEEGSGSTEVGWRGGEIRELSLAVVDDSAASLRSDWPDGGGEVAVSGGCFTWNTPWSLAKGGE